MDRIVILDFGSQYTQLIARRVREAKVYCEIHPYTMSCDQVRAFAPKGIILSGGPASVTEPGAPRLDPALLALGLPVLGICYGMQAMAAALGGRVARGTGREYGRASVRADAQVSLFHGIGEIGPGSRVPSPGSRVPSPGSAPLAPGSAPPAPQVSESPTPTQVPRALRTAESLVVWMSHGDHVDRLPRGFRAIATSTNGVVAAMADDRRRLYGLQFHPEVVHTEWGKELLGNFLFAICGCRADWSMHSFADAAVARVREQVRSGRVLCGVSGGVDSSVVAALLHRALGDRLVCIFVDNGLLRKDEAAKIPRLFREHLGMQIIRVDAAQRFLEKLAGIDDPEEKRKRIGHEFVAVFEEEAHKVGGAQFLAQGTLYPDVIESVSTKGPSATIKSHHNVGGLPDRMGLALVEPLRELFKDEVRELGRELGMPEELIQRQPFPGPGLAVRILGAITEDRLAILRAADDVMMQEIKAAGWYDKVWQSFCVLLPVKTVGVMGDERTYENVVALRVVASQDGMTADWVPLPYELLGRVSSRIINAVQGVNRVVYDISSKPPATIEWE